MMTISILHTAMFFIGAVFLLALVVTTYMPANFPAITTLLRTPYPKEVLIEFWLAASMGILFAFMRGEWSEVILLSAVLIGGLGMNYLNVRRAKRLERIRTTYVLSKDRK